MFGFTVRDLKDNGAVGVFGCLLLLLCHQKSVLCVHAHPSAVLSASLHCTTTRYDRGPKRPSRKRVYGRAAGLRREGLAEDAPCVCVLPYRSTRGTNNLVYLPLLNTTCPSVPDGQNRRRPSRSGRWTQLYILGLVPWFVPTPGRVRVHCS